MPNIPDLRRRTKQALSIARRAVLAEAAEIVAARGPAALIVTHLARKHDIAPLTVRRWLAGAAHDLSHLARGRPSFARLGGEDAVCMESGTPAAEPDTE
jgi:predicted transcriptional regulator